MEGELQVGDNTAKYQPRPPGTTSRFKQLGWVAKNWNCVLVLWRLGMARDVSMTL